MVAGHAYKRRNVVAPDVRLAAQQPPAGAGDRAGQGRFVLRLLLKIKHALDDYHILGVRPVEAAVNETVGALSRQPQATAKVAKNKFSQRFFGLVVALDIILNMGANVIALEAATQPSPSPVVIQIVRESGAPLELPPGVWQPGTETVIEADQ